MPTTLTVSGLPGIPGLPGLAVVPEIEHRAPLRAESSSELSARAEAAHLELGKPRRGDGSTGPHPVLPAAG